MPATQRQAQPTSKPSRKPSSKVEEQDDRFLLDKKRVEYATRKLNTELREKFNKIQKSLRLSYANELKHRSLIGRIVGNIKRAPKKYGEKGVELLAKALGIDATTLYDYAKVAACWSKQEITDLSKRRSISGLHVSFSHLIELAVLDSKDERDEWLEHVLDAGLSVRQLRVHLKAGQQVPQLANAEEQRQVGPPRWVRGLQALTASTETMLQQVQLVEETLDELSTDDMDQAKRDLVEKTLKSQEQMLERCERAMNRLHDAFNKIEKKEPTDQDEPLDAGEATETG